MHDWLHSPINFVVIPFDVYWSPLFIDLLPTSIMSCSAGIGTDDDDLGGQRHYFPK